MPIGSCGPSGRPLTDGTDCLVQLRAHGTVTPATVSVDGDSVIARLRGTQRGVAAGQALVMYDDDEVLGSATITRGQRATHACSV